MVALAFLTLTLILSPLEATADISTVEAPAVPVAKIKGIRIVKQSKRAIEERFDKREDPRKRIYYWLTGEIIKSDGRMDADIEAIRKNYIAITPINCDMTNYSFIDNLKEWKF